MTSSHSPLDDAALERLLAGRTVEGHPELEPLTTLVRAVRGLEIDPPAPRGHLAALLAAGFDPAETPAAADDVPVWAPPVPARSRVLRHPATRVAGLSLVAKVLLGGGVAVAGVTSAAGAGVLPGPVQDGVSTVVEAVTPFEVPRATPTTPGQDGPGTGSSSSRPSVPAGPPSSLPAAPGGRPATPGRTAPPEQAPEQAGRPTDVPGRTASPEPAPEPAPDRTRPAPPRANPEPSRAGEPAPPAQQAPGQVTEPAPGRGDEQVQGQQEAPAPAADEPGPTAGETVAPADDIAAADDGPADSEPVSKPAPRR